MFLYVYRLRRSGIRQDRTALRGSGLRGDFVYKQGLHEYWGKRPIYAKLLEPGTSNELIPYLEAARIVRVRRGLLVTGVEVHFRASKSKGERHRQTWICTLEPISDSEWPEPPRDPMNRGFDPADDDAE